VHGPFVDLTALGKEPDSQIARVAQDAPHPVVHVTVVRDRRVRVFAMVASERASQRSQTDGAAAALFVEHSQPLILRQTVGVLDLTPPLTLTSLGVVLVALSLLSTSAHFAVRVPTCWALAINTELGIRLALVAG